MESKRVLFAPEFLITPIQVIRDKSLSPLDHNVYAVCYWFERLKDGKCTASNDTIAEVLGLEHGRSIQRSLEKLESAGYIKRFYEDETNQKRKEITCLVHFKKAGESMTAPSSNTMTAPSYKYMTARSLEKEKFLKKENVSVRTDDSVKSLEKVAPLEKTNETNEFLGLFKAVNPTFHRLYSNKSQRLAMGRLLKQFGPEKTRNMIACLEKILGKPYAPVIATPYDLERKLPNLISFLQKEKSTQVKNRIAVIQ